MPERSICPIGATSVCPADREIWPSSSVGSSEAEIENDGSDDAVELGLGWPESVISAPDGSVVLIGRGR